MPDVTLRNETGEGALTIGRPISPDSDFYDVPVRINAPGLHCAREVLTYRGDDLPGFFMKLAADWRGWEGELQWGAIEHGLSITAVHAGRRVELLFTLRQSYGQEGWQVTFPLTVAPGEDLTRLARDLATAFDGV